MTACKVYKLAEVYIKQKLVKTNNILFVTELSIQSDEVNDEIDIKDSEVNIVIKAFKASEVNIVTVALKALKVNIVTVASEAPKT